MDQINIPMTTPAADVNLQDFVTKDSGKREQFESGMQRDTQDGKLRADLAFDGPILRFLFREGPKGDAGTAMCDWYDEAIKRNVTSDEAFNVIRLIAPYEGGLSALMTRYAKLMTRGSIKYEARNWMKAEGYAEMDRFISSGCRHFLQWYRGDTDEDHAAAVIFNLNGYEYVRRKMELPF